MLATSIITDLVGGVLPLAADDGVLDLIDQKLREAKSTLLQAAGVFAVVFIIMQAVSAKGAVARVVVAGIAAAIFMFVIDNVEFLSGKVDNELNSAPAAPIVADVSHVDSGSHAS